jgi:hypothetical protein
MSQMGHKRRLRTAREKSGLPPMADAREISNFLRLWASFGLMHPAKMSLSIPHAFQEVSVLGMHVAVGGLHKLDL